MPAPVFNPTPRQSFQMDKDAMGGHLNLISSPQLTASIQTALLEYQRKLAHVTDMNGAAASHFKMAGAIEFLDVFWKLAEQKTSGRVRAEGQLLPTS